MTKKGRKVNILWLGGLHSDFAVQKRKAANPAATKWTRGLIRGLLQNGCCVTGLTHCYEQLWPKGEFLPGQSRDFDSTIDKEVIRYINIPILKDRWLSVAYRNGFKRILSRKEIDCVVCYNSLHPYHVSVMREAEKLGVPNFSIILDGDDPERDDWRAILQETRFCSGVIFLSQWACDNYPGERPVLHLDGGSDSWFGDDFPIIKDTYVLYSGALDHWRGGEFLRDVATILNDKNIKLVVCGKSDGSLFKGLGNVEFKGFVSNEELHSLSRRASVFVSTRDIKLGDNKLNFPSKILNYLAYGKPVVSTWLPSFSEEYRKHLIVPDGNDPLQFAESIEDTLNWSEQRYVAYSESIKKWFCKTRLWRKQAAKLQQWLEVKICKNQEQENAMFFESF